MYKDKTILITGGTGSWGHVLTSRLLLQDPKEIRIFSRSELSQVYMAREFSNPKIKFIIGDVRNREALDLAMKDVDYVFHLAALKHVPICEEQPNEAILTNIDGTKNVIHAAIKNGVKKVIDVSTDKAVAPYNLYGMTKSVGERLIINANKLSSTTDFVCVRGGNVIGSNGSVVPLFIEQIKKYNYVTITDVKMTRYFISLEEAIDLLTKAAEISVGGEILVMNMPACKILDLAKVLIDVYGNEKTKIKKIGSRPGEKLHEELISVQECPNSYVVSNNYFLITPNTPVKELSSYYNTFKDYKKVTFKSFNSSQNLMNYEEIKDKLIQIKFI